ncbi:MAG: DUF1257 domain-containing protein [Pyrinomonadaceae bacterium MAG19_C2-C3]|nr:DUF1257 domain-containing protein [Pyrinomonadaceae bacterium MAG19_C2-C3]
MSKYLAFNEVVFKDTDLLVRALADIGCTHIQQGTNLQMGTYFDEQREQNQTAEVIIPRNSIGNHFGDIGFVQTDKGLAPVLDEYDQPRVMGGQFISRLRAAYNERAVRKVAERVRGTIHRTVSGNITKIKVRF